MTAMTVTTKYTNRSGHAVSLSSHLNHFTLHNAQLSVVPGHEVVNDAHVQRWLSGPEMVADTLYNRIAFYKWAHKAIFTGV